MITLDKGCEIALNRFDAYEYLHGLCGIFDTGDEWIFFGKMSEGDGVEYGNCPLIISKESGICKDFPLGIVKNYDLCARSKYIVVPKKYELKIRK